MNTSWVDNVKDYIADLSASDFVSIGAIIALVLFGRLALILFARRIARLADDGDDSRRSQEEKRAETLSHVFVSIGTVLVIMSIVFLTLGQLGVDLRPVLAGAGIIALAIGFGTQSLVKDFVSGLFILIENQYGIGDQVKIGSFEGEVVRITMRSTVLRGEDGSLYYMSNGSISNVTNHSQGVKPDLGAGDESGTPGRT